MVLIVIFALAALFFLFRGLFSLGGAMQSKQLEDEIATARVEISRLYEQKLFVTAQESFNTHVNKINNFCYLNRINQGDKSTKILFAVEFEKWGRNLMGNNVKSIQKTDTLPAIPKKEVEDNFEAQIQICFADLNEITRFRIGLYLYSVHLTSGAHKNPKKAFDLSIISMLLAIPSNANIVMECIHKVSNESGNIYQKYLSEAADTVNGLEQNKIEILSYLTMYALNQFDTNDLNGTDRQVVDYFLCGWTPRIYNLITKKSFNELGKLFKDNYHSIKFGI